MYTGCIGSGSKQPTRTKTVCKSTGGTGFLSLDFNVDFPMMSGNADRYGSGLLFLIGRRAGIMAQRQGNYKSRMICKPQSPISLNLPDMHLRWYGTIRSEIECSLFPANYTGVFS